ncbi:uncharacterized protein DDB_G0288805-like isoform X2 [Panonychus citri]|nr:uncharacterized protein DDB_G0288805-like isoform X2 [Panonychus citri]XP_053204266.1 uncharacterized protein DDB_G0288805-like isoform X2 [Panonychus citri]
MSLVSHYTVFTDGLWTSLGEPCPHLMITNNCAYINPNNNNNLNPVNQITSELILTNNNNDNENSNNNNTLRHQQHLTVTNNNNNNNIMSGVLTCRRNHTHLQHQHHQQQYQLQQSASQQQSTNYRSISTERSRNLINSNHNNSSMRMRNNLTASSSSTSTHSHPTSSSSHHHSSVKLKDWLSTINHKWSQLISAVTPKNDLSNSVNHNNSHGHQLSVNRLARRGHHFSTLPRNHFLNQNNHLSHHFNSTSQQHHHLNHLQQSQHHPNNQRLHDYQQQSFNHQQSLYDFANNGHQNSLNFRSLNVEINSPWINNPNHNFLLNRGNNFNSNHVNLLRNTHGTNEIVTESNHYQETDLFPRREINNSNRNVKDEIESDSNHQVPFITNNLHQHHNNNNNNLLSTFNCPSNQLISSTSNGVTTFISTQQQQQQQQPTNNLSLGNSLNGVEYVKGKPNGGFKVNGTSGPYLVKGIIKSSSVEDIYTATTISQKILISPFDDEIVVNPDKLNSQDNDNDKVNQLPNSSSILIPPLPVPRKSKPGTTDTIKSIVQYANQEIIKLQRKSSSLDDCNGNDDDDNHRSDLLLFDEIVTEDEIDDDQLKLHQHCNQQIKTLIELITDGYFNQTFRGSNWPTSPHVNTTVNTNEIIPLSSSSSLSTTTLTTTSTNPFTPSMSSSISPTTTTTTPSSCLNNLNASNCAQLVVSTNEINHNSRPNDKVTTFSASITTTTPTTTSTTTTTTTTSTPSITAATTTPTIPSESVIQSKSISSELNSLKTPSEPPSSSSSIPNESNIEFLNKCLQKVNCSSPTHQDDNHNPNYEEINEELMKEIEATRPSIEVLREFDLCFLPTSDDKRRSSEPNILSESANVINNNCSSQIGPEIRQKCNKLGLLGSTKNQQPSSSTTTHWTSIDASGVISMYDYDALKFDREFIVKEASLGLTSLQSTSSGSQVKLNELDLICLEEDPEEVNKSLTRYRQGPISLDPKFITLQKPLGNGYFGEVFLGTIPSSSGCASIQVAVKVLKLKAIPNHKSEILREAQTMSALDHKHIVRLIGVCEVDPIMIVMELAPLGPLNQYLLDHGFVVTIKDIIALLLQVAMAMQYLESKQFIHRDLAARNVLLVNEKFAKVSDFGMSRALGIGKEYYKAKSASKWPLKWYAPECIYYFKFSTKSDVWSYGVTMWESLSYGQKPYEGMDGQDILRLFRENRRLPKPENCPQEIYQLMWKCWQFRPEDRPTFSEICQTMTTYFLCSNI